MFASAFISLHCLCCNGTILSFGSTCTWLFYRLKLSMRPLLFLKEKRNLIYTKFSQGKKTLWEKSTLAYRSYYICTYDATSIDGLSYSDSVWVESRNVTCPRVGHPSMYRDPLWNCLFEEVWESLKIVSFLFYPHFLLLNCYGFI